MLDEFSPPIICVVDDERSLLKSYCALLKSADFAPVPFTSGNDLLNSDSLTQASCILLDIWMPPPDGMETLRRILARVSDPPPVVIITGHGDIPLAVEAMKLGAADFLEKPVDDDELIRLVEDQVAKHLGGSLESASASVQSDEAAATDLRCLTPREREIVDLLVQGLTNKEIARELGISYRTVEVHRARIMDKTRAQSFSHLIRMAIA